MYTVTVKHKNGIDEYKCRDIDDALLTATIARGNGNVSSLSVEATDFDAMVYDIIDDFYYDIDLLS